MKENNVRMSVLPFSRTVVAPIADFWLLVFVTTTGDFDFLRILEFWNQKENSVVCTNNHKDIYTFCYSQFTPMSGQRSVTQIPIFKDVRSSWFFVERLKKENPPRYGHCFEN
jgi:hypothetical protein